MSKLIPLSGNRGKGLFATVDDAMFELLNKHSWHLACGRYAAMRTKDGLFHMHRVVAGAVKSEEVDHIDGDGLNNQRLNLRTCTHRQNVWNSKPSSATGYRGVIKKNNRFFARVKTDDTDWVSPYFRTPAEAAQAYNDKAAEVFGEFAWLNPIEPYLLTEEYIADFSRKLHASRAVTRRNTSGFHGVSRHKQTGQRFASTTFEGTTIKLTLVDTPEEAAFLYDQMCLQLRGDRSRLNTLFD